MRIALAVLMLNGNSTLLYLWFRLNPHPYSGVCAPRLGLLVSAGALDALDGG
jgi:hypothetical protein